MRYILVFLVLPLMVGLVAWAQYDTRAALEVVVVESLDPGTASDVLPIFETELGSRLAVDRRRANFVRIRIEPNRASIFPEPERLASADLVVSFGVVAAESVSRALHGSTTPHLFAYLPRALALALGDDPSHAGRGLSAELSGQWPRGAALAIATQLLASRNAPPLRIGVVHQTPSESAPSAVRFMAEVAESPDITTVPFVLPENADRRAILASVGAAAAEAAGRELPIDAFWLALDTTAPLELLVRVIETRTGRPVVYAASEAAVAAGALMSLAPEPRSTAREAAGLAKRLLDGATRPAVPLRAPYRVEFSLNLETADALGIVPSHELMELARGRLFR